MTLRVRGSGFSEFITRFNSMLKVPGSIFQSDPAISSAVPPTKSGPVEPPQSTHSFPFLSICILFGFIPTLMVDITDSESRLITLTVLSLSQPPTLVTKSLFPEIIICSGPAPTLILFKMELSERLITLTLFENQSLTYPLFALNTIYLGP
jgi:hypothetical protein